MIIYLKDISLETLKTVLFRNPQFEKLHLGGMNFDVRRRIRYKSKKNTCWKSKEIGVCHVQELLS